MPLQPDPALEFRPDHKGRFDEIVARKPDMVHVETMSSKSVYIGFSWDDGRYCQLWISADKKLHYSHEDGFLPPRDSGPKPDGRDREDGLGAKPEGHGARQRNRPTPPSQTPAEESNND